MHHRLRYVLASAAVVALISAPPALAHEERKVGDHVFVVGWLDEPTFSGFMNAVSVSVHEHGIGGQEEGPPVDDAELEVEVLFGGEDAEESVGPVPLEPAFGAPGEYEATLIPNRPGQYTFHVTGIIDDEEIDEFFTSGPDTFSDVGNPDDIEFPAQDPSSGELAEAVERLQGRVAELTAAIQEEPAAEDTAASARLLAIVGIAIGGLGALIAIAALARGRSASR
jgi:hypothetical protein